MALRGGAVFVGGPPPLGGRAWLAFAARRDPRLVYNYTRTWGARVVYGYTAWYGDPDEPRQEPAGALSHDAGLGWVEQHVGAWEQGEAFAAAVAAVAAASRRTPERAQRMPGTRSLGELLYALVRSARPQAVVETGVATGVSSVFLLAGLIDNGEGRLYSIDLPPIDLVGAGLVGFVVPREFRERWTYAWGPSKRFLGKVLEATAGERRLFLHDSLHSEENMTFELETARRSLRSGDVLAADDADLNGAFAAVAAAAGAATCLVRQSGKPAATGIAVLP